MATTALIVEMLVIGSSALVWITLFVLSRWGQKLLPAIEALEPVADWIPLLSIIGIGLLYQLGWLLNFISQVLIESWGGGTLIRKSIFKRESLEYESVRLAVYQKASIDARADLGLDRSVVRLSRAAIINFCTTGLVLFYYPSVPKLVPCAILLLSILCWVQWYVRFTRYYRRMIKLYLLI